VDDIVREAGVAAEKVEYMSLDLGSFTSIRAFAAAYLAKNIPIHMLILNAGVMIPDWAVTQEGFETTFGINHVGHFLLTSLLIEKVKASQPSRVVVLASTAHTMGNHSVLDVVREEKDYSKYRAYGNSKLANVLFAKELNRRLQGTGVSANALHPGVIHTELSRSSWGAQIFYTVATPFNKNIPQGAATTCFVATHPSVTPENSGVYYADSKIVEPSATAKDATLAKNLWALSEQLIGANFLHEDEPVAAPSAPVVPNASL
jgi:NAD(P)-dependent dehydrogenase (short-subunit alcohol dehydrogenase family)